MIGYNVKEIEDLAKNIADSYETIGKKMAEPWKGLQTVLENEWVGPDELSYETELAKNICTLYASCTSSIQNMLDNLRIMGDNWKNFQKGNVLENADTSMMNSGVFANEIEIATIKPYEIANIVKAGSPNFSANTKLGLTNGTQSSVIIKTEFDKYIESVKKSVKELYSKFDSSKAFLGGQLNAKVNEYLQNMGSSLADLATCHKSIYDALDKLTAQYTTHETDEAKSVSSANINVDTQGQSINVATQTY